MDAMEDLVAHLKGFGEVESNDLILALNSNSYSKCVKVRNQANTIINPTSAALHLGCLLKVSSLSIQ